MTMGRLRELERKAKSLVGGCAITQVGISGFYYKPGDAVKSTFQRWASKTIAANQKNELREAGVL